jgi:hypothetical protein
MGVRRGGQGPGATQAVFGGDQYPAVYNLLSHPHIVTLILARALLGLGPSRAIATGDRGGGVPLLGLVHRRRDANPFLVPLLSIMRSSPARVGRASSPEGRVTQIVEGVFLSTSSSWKAEIMHSMSWTRAIPPVTASHTTNLVPLFYRRSMAHPQDTGSLFLSNTTPT